MYARQDTINMEPFFHQHFGNCFGSLIWSADGKAEFSKHIGYNENIFLAQFWWIDFGEV